MTLVNRILLVALPLVSITIALVEPRLRHFGVTRSPSGALNADDCRELAGLAGCRDAWVDHERRVAYLCVLCPVVPGRRLVSSLLGFSLGRACSTTLKLYSFSSGLSSTIELVRPGPSSGSHEFSAASITGFVHGDNDDTVSLFVASDDAAVVEVFEATRRKSHATSVRTVRHDLVASPAALVATGPASFFVTNDRASRTTRHRFEWLYSAPSTIVHCDANRLATGGQECIVALDGITRPTGIALDRESSTLYVSSVMTGEVTTYEVQSDYTLFPLAAKISLGRPIDRLDLDPSTDALYAASTSTRTVLDLVRSPSTRNDDDAVDDHPRPVEVWRIEREQGQAKFYGHPYKSTLLLSDPENVNVSRISTAAVFEHELLLLTGPSTKRPAVMCRLAQELETLLERQQSQ
ncbi:hypothetical protein JCM11491_004784 [Sporobolomyces phaffii]